MKNTIKVSKLIFTIVFVLLSINSCKDEADCQYITACGGDAAKPKVDLIVLIDTSSSMGGSANVISTEAQSAINNALNTCNSDLRVVYLGVDGTWSGTNFSQSHRNYIYGIHGTSVTLAADQPFVGYTAEQGANAIEDLSKYFDWRTNACKAIYYISDERLDSITSNNANDDAATASAIVGANANNVAVFATYLTYQNLNANVLQNYTDITSQTGGILNTANAINAGYYSNSDVFQKIICNACNGCAK